MVPRPAPRQRYILYKNGQIFLNHPIRVKKILRFQFCFCSKDKLIAIMIWKCYRSNVWYLFLNPPLILGCCLVIQRTIFVTKLLKDLATRMIHHRWLELRRMFGCVRSPCKEFVNFLIPCKPRNLDCWNKALVIALDRAFWIGLH